MGDEVIIVGKAAPWGDCVGGWKKWAEAFPCGTRWVSRFCWEWMITEDGRRDPSGTEIWHQRPNAGDLHRYRSFEKTTEGA
jgi:hypothetical protein